MQSEPTSADRAVGADELEDRLRHALQFVEEARRATVQALNLVARIEHERDAERERVVLR